jgi:hypothetical protein
MIVRKRAPELEEEYHRIFGLTSDWITLAGYATDPSPPVL